MIELCATMFDWAKYRQAKGALKVHLLLDHDGYLPVFARITEGREHELLTLRKLHFARGTIVAFDRAYRGRKCREGHLFPDDGDKRPSMAWFAFSILSRFHGGSFV